MWLLQSLLFVYHLCPFIAFQIITGVILLYLRQMDGPIALIRSWTETKERDGISVVLSSTYLALPSAVAASRP